MPETEPEQSPEAEAAETPEVPAPSASPAKKVKKKHPVEATQDLTNILLGAVLKELVAPEAFKELVGNGGAVAEAAAGLKGKAGKQTRRRTGLSIYNIFCSLMMHHAGAKLSAAGVCWRGLGEQQQQQQQLEDIKQRLNAIKPTVDQLAAQAAASGGDKVQIADVLEEYEEEHELDAFDWKGMFTALANTPEKEVEAAAAAAGGEEDTSVQQQQDQAQKQKTQKHKVSTGKKQPAAPAAPPAVAAAVSAPAGRASKKKKKHAVAASDVGAQQHQEGKEAPAAKKRQKHHKKAAEN